MLPTLRLKHRMSVIIATLLLANLPSVGDNAVSAQDPMSQLAEWGYPLGSFEDGEALFLKALDDGQLRVMRAALQANIKISPNILIYRTMPGEIWGDLEYHRNWVFGMSLCESVSEGEISIVKLRERNSENFSRLSEICSEEVGAAMGAEEAALAAAAEEEAKKQEEKNRISERKRKALNAVKEACREFYEGPDFYNGMTAAIAEYINTGGDYWNPPSFEVPGEYEDDIREDWNIYASNYSWFLGHAQSGTIGAFPDGSIEVVNPSSRIKTLDDYFESSMHGIVENYCRFEYR